MSRLRSIYVYSSQAPSLCGRMGMLDERTNCHMNNRHGSSALSALRQGQIQPNKPRFLGMVAKIHTRQREHVGAGRGHFTNS